MSAAFVYVLSNPAIPGMVKIGHSERPLERLTELSSATGVPIPFVQEGAMSSCAAALAEQIAHEELAHLRVNPKREFFRIDPESALSVVRYSVLAAAVEVIAKHSQEVDVGQLLSNPDFVRNAKEAATRLKDFLGVDA